MKIYAELKSGRYFDQLSNYKLSMMSWLRVVNGLACPSVVGECRCYFDVTVSAILNTIK